MSQILVPLTMLYMGLLGVVIGSLASAEERQLGMHDVQLLIPVAAAKQWIVKAGVALGLAVAFGAVMPALLIHLVEDVPMGTARALLAPAMLIIVLTSISLYVSSLSSSGLRATAMSVPAVVAVGVLMLTASAALDAMSTSPFVVSLMSVVPPEISQRVLRTLSPWSDAGRPAVGVRALLRVPEPRLG